MTKKKIKRKIKGEERIDATNFSSGNEIYALDLIRIRIYLFELKKKTTKKLI